MSESPTEMPVRTVAVLDGTSAAVERQTRALGGFLREGLTVGIHEGAAGDVRVYVGDGPTSYCPAETLVFYADDDQRERLVEVSPTGDVQLVRTGPRRIDLMLERLVGEARGELPTLFLFASGPTGTELATRLACRAGGSVLTEVVSAEIGPALLACRRNVYSAHMTGRFELTGHPWCVTIDACWHDAAHPAPAAHRVLSDTDETGRTDAPPFDDVQLVESPKSGDLPETRFLVVAGYGVGDRDGVQRVAEAARRMGASFGVTRPVAMNAWASVDRLIGVSGTRTAPALCIVAGASGAPAFQWGIEKAGLIVAVNPDERAAIAANADAVVLDDGVAVVEALADLVVEERGGR